MAVVVWLLATPVGFVLPGLVGRDPFSPGGPVLPLLAAVALTGAVLLAALRWRVQALAGAAAGLAAAWLALMLRTALHGTPFGFGGLAGDMMRMAASVTRYSVTATTSDTTILGLPSEYPPLYAWSIGRASALLDIPAWRLLADAEVLTMSAALIAAFVLWSRQFNAWVAFAVSSLSLAAWSDPRKAFEVLALAVFVPWALETFARPTGRRLHWLPAGLLGGFLVVTYQAWMVYAAFAIITLMVLTWRAEPNRGAYLRHLGLVVLVSFIASSWYVVPYLWSSFGEGGEMVSDLYISDSYTSGMLPFFEINPLGILEFVGLVGLVWLWRSTWWARPLLLIALSAFVYRMLAMARFLLSGHTMFGHYTVRLYEVVLAIAGVLVVAHVAPIVLRRMRLTPPRAVGAAALAVVLAWAGVSFTKGWMPDGSAYSVSAHAEPLPGGGYPPYAPRTGKRTWFPVEPVRREVEKITGPDPQLVTLAVDERLFSYLPWPGYISNDRTAGSTMSRWDERMSELRRLTRTTDPAAFAAESATTKFGGIDIFVLRRKPDGWAWNDLRFAPAQFDKAHWTVIDGLPQDVVVAVRK
ncbi:arabinofuranosyltransferase [Micromonospora sp. NPDC049679]|uniref:arabinofuranosyltransferase n=1 Tax=Micromonospora sp. NPDC049679 TaxID=3155920 RepID=UPI0033E78577